MKQGANSAVRFTSYATLQQLALDYMRPETGKLGSATTFGLGAIAGLITVCEYRLGMRYNHALTPDTTMPLDNIKTRMQAAGAETRYRNSLHCLVTVSYDDPMPCSGALTLDN